MFPINIQSRAMARFVIDALLLGAAASGLGLALTAPLVAEFAVMIRQSALPTRA